MQAQATHTQSISSAQSLACVKTLLTAGLGCITYLRNLLPTDNFSQSHFTSANEDSVSQSSTPESRGGSRSNVSAFKIMTLTRGFTEEADKLLNYMEYGIFDALQRQYLRSFILAVHLDENDPNNIVEAYTFNFHYHTIPGTDTTVPVMTLDDQLDNMSLTGNKSKKKNKHFDPVNEAIIQGKAPTILEVKKSVKALLKRLIHATTQMDPLPKRRYATFKLTYTDKTPAEYEPPNFAAGDSDKDRWFFTTHSRDEVPEKWSVGHINTGHHSVAVNVTSITSYLPSMDDNNATFTGMAATTGPSLTPMQEANMRAQDADMQLVDAEKRAIAWDAADADADGEEDPDYIMLPDGHYERIQTHSMPSDTSVPIGRRNSIGVIVPFTNEEKIELLQKEEQVKMISGISETVPQRVGDFIKHTKQVINAPLLEQTQTLEATQAIHDMEEGLLTPMSSSPLVPSSLDIDNDSEMLDLMTQVVPTFPSPAPMDEDSIESFATTSVNIDAGMDENSFVQDSSPHQRTSSTIPEQTSPGGEKDSVKCECEITIEDETCFCEGGCGNWYHLWCMGFHSLRDKRIPDKFICFDCRVRMDPCWELIQMELYPKMTSKFKELAMFRRAIKIAEVDGAETVVAFSKHYGCNTVLGRQLFNRLEAEGFIMTETTETDELGLVSKKTAKKGKQAKLRKNLKSRYVFNKAMRKTQEYADYFNPDQDVESRMLGLADMKASFKNHAKRKPIPTPEIAEEMAPMQTQLLIEEMQQESQNQQVIIGMESQLPTLTTNSAGKRTLSAAAQNISPRPVKKVKISVTAALDLAE